MIAENLIKEGWLKTPRIIEAFEKIKRADFVPEKFKDMAEADEALPIGFDQTISQPLVVAFMLELLQPEPGNKVLDIGSGSGWTTALLAEISKSKVVGIELIPELAEFGRNNVAKYDFIKNGLAEVICANGSRGYDKEAPYDRILASASVAGEIPKAWKRQLAPGGRIVTPIRDSIWLLTKNDAGSFEETEYPGFIFVPLVES